MNEIVSVFNGYREMANEGKPQVVGYANVYRTRRGVYLLSYIYPTEALAQVDTGEYYIKTIPICI